ncbi:hypothetical protein H4S08_001973 [Coemansia sp. RSA 1365]|nr:hypothetical protein H4S08_001973 [Coemansia sp. RSA 1365]
MAHLPKTVLVNNNTGITQYNVVIVAATGCPAASVIHSTGTNWTFQTETDTRTIQRQECAAGIVRSRGVAEGKSQEVGSHPWGEAAMDKNNSKTASI